MQLQHPLHQPCTFYDDHSSCFKLCKSAVSIAALTETRQLPVLASVGDGEPLPTRLVAERAQPQPAGHGVAHGGTQKDS